VVYPAQLDLRPFTSLGEVRSRPASASASADGSDDDPSRRYELCGVVMHHGSAYGGHYTSYVRLSRPGGGTVWAHADDERVDIGASEQEVVGSALTQERAYMLFYSKRVPADP
jgi:ubiquitin C-terminal hydrolase